MTRYEVTFFNFLSTAIIIFSRTPGSVVMALPPPHTWTPDLDWDSPGHLMDMSRDDGQMRILLGLSRVRPLNRREEGQHSPAVGQLHHTNYWILIGFFSIHKKIREPLICI